MGLREVDRGIRVEEARVYDRQRESQELDLALNPYDMSTVLVLYA